MSKDEHFLGASVVSLDKEEEKARLIQRLRQYLEVRNLTLLIGNGCNLSPTIDKIGVLLPDI